MAERETRLIERLDALGIAPEVTTAALEIDAILQRWRRRFAKRELGVRAIADLDLDLDLAQLDALIAVWAPRNEFGADPGTETMVATVAERLGIDPSRASRLASELIRKRLIRRAASQTDGRRTVLEMTDEGARMVDAIQRYKFIALGDFLSHWTPEELASFIPLFERIHAWTDQTARLPERLNAEVAQLRAALHKPLPE